MNPNEENLAKDMSELKKEGIDILPNDMAQKAYAGKQSAQTDREEEKFVTDKIPTVFKEAPRAPRRAPSAPDPQTLGPDILSEASVKLTSSVPVTEARPKAPPPPPPQSNGPKTLSDEISNILNPRVGALTPQAPINSPDIKPLRTYRTDAEEAIRNQRMSVVNIAVAESKRKEKRAEKAEEAVKNPPEASPILSPELVPPEKTSRFSISALFLSFVFLAAGVGAIYFVFIKSTSEPTKEPAVVAPSLSVFGESDTRQFSVSNILTPLESYGEMLGSIEGIRLGDIVRVVAVEKKSGMSEPMHAGTFFNRSAPSMPGRLLRSIENFALGAHEFDGVNPFMVIDVNSFENGFAGMLEWERTIPLELAPLIRLSHGSIDTAGAAFHDKVIRNKDTRVLRTLDENDILFYTFTDTGTILIATKQATLERLIDNLTTTRVIR